MRILVCYLSLLALLGISSCHPKPTIRQSLQAYRQFTLPGHNPATAQLVVENTGTSSARFLIKLNDSFYHTESEIVQEVINMPDECENEPLERKAWRYVIKHVKYSDPLTSENWQHSPALMINSVGNGLCDDLSSTLNIIWTKLGFQSRVWSLEGHVVAEVYVNGKWQMYDPTFQAYYLNEKQEILGVQELSEHPEMVTEVKYTAVIKNQSIVSYALRHAKKTADLYATKSNNTVNEGYNFNVNLADTMFCLPAGAKMKLPVLIEKEAQSACNNFPPDYSLLSVELATGEKPSLQIPLVIYAIQGKGKVTIDSTEFNINSPELNNYLQDFSRFNQRLTFSGKGFQAKVLYLLNNRAVHFSNTNILTIRGYKIAQLTASIVEDENSNPNDNYAVKIDSIIRSRIADFDKNKPAPTTQSSAFFPTPTDQNNVIERIGRIVNLESGLSIQQKKQRIVVLSQKVKALLEKTPESSKRSKLFTAISNPQVFIIFLGYLEYCDEEFILQQHGLLDYLGSTDRKTTNL